jgi:S1-C subfamily serine protease
MKMNKNIAIISLGIFTLAFVGSMTALGAYRIFWEPASVATAGSLVLDDQEATIRAIKKVDPAVVSIIVSEQDVFEAVDIISGKMQKQNYKKQMQKGTGFLISSDGYILTNKHVVEAAKEDKSSFRIILNNGKQYYAQLIGKDPLNDLAVLKIFDKNLPFIELGDSDKLEMGSTVIAIGNALGRYQNSATKGIVSGLGRSLIANGTDNKSEKLDNVIQTDAKINPGNSGGPLIDLNGKVVGINSAIETAGSAIGFAIPINDARPVIVSIRERGHIVRSFMGVYYQMLSPEILLENNLPRTTGAWIKIDDGEGAVVKDSPADKAGIKDGDIVFEINTIKIGEPHSLQTIIQRYKPGDKIGLKIQRGDKTIVKEVVLGELK